MPQRIGPSLLSTTTGRPPRLRGMILQPPLAARRSRTRLGRPRSCTDRSPVPGGSKGRVRRPTQSVLLASSDGLAGVHAAQPPLCGRPMHQVLGGPSDPPGNPDVRHRWHCRSPLSARRRADPVLRFTTYWTGKQSRSFAKTTGPANDRRMDTSVSSSCPSVRGIRCDRTSLLTAASRAMLPITEGGMWSARSTPVAPSRTAL
jgi:hypothetical protein